MKEVLNSKEMHGQKGGAGVKLIIVGLILFLIGHAGYQYVPTAYSAQDFKQDMKTSVMQGVTLPSTYGKPVAIVKGKLNQAAERHGLPYDRVIDVKKKGDLVTARVYYQVDVPLLPFGLYSYKYVFDHSATPSGFLN